MILAADGPRSFREDLAVALCGNVLRRHWGLGDDFFASGGDSLRAMLLVAQVREYLDAGYSARHLFEGRNIERLVAAVPADAVGIAVEDAEELPTFARLQPVQLQSVPGGAVVRLVDPDLGARVRDFAALNSLAPSVVYLGAWRQVGAATELSANGLAGIGVQLGDGTSAFACRIDEADSGGVPSLDGLRRVQLGLLSACSSTGDAEPSGDLASSFSYGSRLQWPQLPNGAVALSVCSASDGELGVAGGLGEEGLLQRLLDNVREAINSTLELEE